MKYIVLVIIIVVSVLFTSNQFASNPPAEPTDIQLHIEGASPAWIFLQGVHKNVKSKLDSVRIDAMGKAVFKYPTSLDPGYYTIQLPGDIALPLLLDRDQAFSLTTHIGQPIRDMQVSGSQENSLLYDNLQFDIDLQERFQEEIQQIQQKGEQALNEDFIGQLRQKYFTEKENYLKNAFRRYPNTLFTKFEKAKQQPEVLSTIYADPSLDDAARQQKMLSSFWDNVDFSDARLLRTPVIFDKLWQYLNEYVPNQTNLKMQAADLLMEKVMGHPEYYAFFAKYIAEEYMAPYTGNMDPDALYVHMVDHYLTEERALWADSTQVYAWQLRAKDRRGSLTGRKGGNIAAKDPNGNTRALYDIKTPYIALFFYHYDCDHCIETAPKLAEQYPALKEQGLEIYAVAMDTPEEEWKAFIEKNNMNWINVTDQDNMDIYQQYFVRATPEIMLLNPDRTIIGKHLTVADLPMVMQMDQQGMFGRETASSDQK